MTHSGPPGVSLSGQLSTQPGCLSLSVCLYRKIWWACLLGSRPDALCLSFICSCYSNEAAVAPPPGVWTSWQLTQCIFQPTYPQLYIWSFQGYCRLDYSSLVLAFKPCSDLILELILCNPIACKPSEPFAPVIFRHQVFSGHLWSHFVIARSATSCTIGLQDQKMCL